MGFRNRLLKAEHYIWKRVENAFGHGAAQTPLEVRREILDQVEFRIVIDTDGRRFPFGKIMVQLKPPTEALRDVFESAFLQDSSLKSDILGKLKDSQSKYPGDLDVIVEIMPVPEAPPPEHSPLFQMVFVKPEPLPKTEIPGTTLVVVKGTAEKAEYRYKKDRILVGRLAEVLDREGRLVRRNDVVFLDNGEDINSTVGRSHARIWYDQERQDFCIMDEASRFGTRIIREGRSIDVPSANPRGIRLRPGDEIYFGQACLRFELTS